MSSFVIEAKEQDGILEFGFSGQIDEDASFDTANISAAKRVKINLENVSAINSCGIREWIKWIKTASGAEEIVYQNCPKVIVDQINMVAGFLPENGRVESFYVPYYSEETDEEKMVLFKSGVEFSEGEVNPPGDVKDSSGEEMEMDIIEAKYFKFLK
ncbi:MAG: hypothetical protein KDD61_10995 [Bdellovibrionales bacterium]|nr:hypothetical protein [Bdellovibrionales bacterium]